MSYDIYISSKISKDFREVIRIANENNVNIEIKDFIKKRVLDNLEGILPDYKEALADFSGKLSMHAAFDKINPVSSDLLERENAICRFNQSIHIAKTLNVKTMVFHSGIDRFTRHLNLFPGFNKKFIEKQVKFWSGFIKSFKNTDIVAVLENTSEKTPDVLLEIVKRVNSEHLKLCIDTGHVNHKTLMNVSEWIEAYGDYLYYMHLHNNWKALDDHNSLLKGTINFKKVFKTLKESPAHPGLSLEISDYNAAMESLNFMRKYL